MIVKYSYYVNTLDGRIFQILRFQHIYRRQYIQRFNSDLNAAMLSVTAFHTVYRSKQSLLVFAVEPSKKTLINIFFAE